MFMAELWTQLGWVCCRVKGFFSGMSLGRKNSMYGSFKGAPGKQFRGFQVVAQSLFIRGLQLRTSITFTPELRFECS